MRAWALLVVSSEAQAETLPHQRAWAQATAAEKGWTIEREFEGVSSGKDGPRKLVRRMMAELRSVSESERPVWILMIRLDRLGRVAEECQFVLAEIRQLGVKVWTREGGEERGNKAMERFVSAAKLYLAEQENEVRRDKARAFYRRRRETGKVIGNKAPYGLRRTKDGGYEIVPDQAEIVRQAYAWRLEGLGLWVIAKRLAAIAPPYRYARSGTKPVHWTSRRVAQLLDRKAYLGTIVDEVTWRRVQGLSDPLGGRPERKHPWPLGGALRCWCGRMMVGNISAHDGKQWRYYRCPATWAHDGRSRLLPALEAEERFAALLHRLGTSDELRTAYRRAQAEMPSPALIVHALSEARKELAQIDRRRDAMLEAVADGTLRGPTAQPMFDRLEAEKAEIAERMQMLESQQAMLANARRAERGALEVVRQAAALWRNPKAIVEERQATAQSIARHFGVCAEPDGTISLRRPVDAGAQRRERA